MKPHPQIDTMFKAILIAVAVLAVSACDSTSQSPTKLKLRDLADKLADADRRGDPTLALQGMKEATDLLASLNDRPDSSRGCVLAAVSVSDGFSDVVRGGRWRNADRFAENLKRCG